MLARLVARMAHRIPGISRVEKSLEGKNLSSGFGSDLVALLVQIYRRNQPEIERVAALELAKIKEKREEQAAKKEAAAAQKEGGS